eukprot:353505-Chlamydomonas_euryale.AAC.3
MGQSTLGVQCRALACKGPWGMRWAWHGLEGSGAYALRICLVRSILLCLKCAGAGEAHPLQKALAPELFVKFFFQLLQELTCAPPSNATAGSPGTAQSVSGRCSSRLGGAPAGAGARRGQPGAWRVRTCLRWCRRPRPGSGFKEGSELGQRFAVPSPHVTRRQKAHVGSAFMCGTRAFMCGTRAFMCGTRAFMCGTRAFMCGTRPFMCGTRPFMCGTMTRIDRGKPWNVMLAWKRVAQGVKSAVS